MTIFKPKPSKSDFLQPLAALTLVVSLFWLAQSLGVPPVS
jgi:hypothetical protein